MSSPMFHIELNDLDAVALVGQVPTEKSERLEEVVRVKELMKRCCNVDPSKRPEAYELVTYLKQPSACRHQMKNKKVKSMINRMAPPICNISPNDVDDLESLGHGAYGQVFLWTHPHSRKQVALKVISQVAAKRKENVHEMVSVEHKNIVKYHGYCIIGNNSLGIVVDLCQGNLQTLMQKENMSVQNAANTLMQIAEGLGYLHAQNIIHHNLKPENILVKTKQVNQGFEFDNLEFKIADLGLSYLVRNVWIHMLVAGSSAGYLAPEILDHKYWNRRKGGIMRRNRHKIDIFSFGKVGSAFLKNVDIGQLGMVVKDVQGLLQECCSNDPLQRPETSSLVGYFKGVNTLLLTAIVEKKERREDILNEKMRNQGENHSETIEAQSNLAETLCQLKMFDEARKLWEDILSKRRKLQGEGHLGTIKAEENLASVLSQLKSYEEAKKLREVVVNKRRNLLGEDHRDTIEAELDLAELLNHLKVFDEARKLYADILMKKRVLLGEGHLETTAAKSNLALTLYHLKLLDESKLLQEEVLKERMKVLGENHVETVEAKSNLAVTLHNLQLYDKAKTLKEEVLLERQASLGNYHSDTIRAKNDLDETLKVLKLLDKARKRKEKGSRRERMMMKQLQRED